MRLIVLYPFGQHSLFHMQAASVSLSASITSDSMALYKSCIIIILIIGIVTGITTLNIKGSARHSHESDLVILG